MAVNAMMSNSVNPKLPTWDGSWSTWPSYRLSVELEMDGTSRDDLERLAPRLVRNLVGRAWDSVTDIDRSKLKGADGVEYLLLYLEQKRGKLKVDSLGDSLSSYFQSNKVTRQDGENWADFEIRHDHYVREINKALKEVGAEKVPPEIFGWFLLNQFLRLEPSDLATIKSVAAGYKLEDIYTAMRKLWSGDTLAQKDSEKKKAKSLGKVLHADVDEPRASEDANTPADEAEEELGDHDEIEGIFEALCEELAEDPMNPEILANFKEVRKMRYSEARKALDKARTNRGFWPHGRKEDSRRLGQTGNKVGFNGRCMRCGKIGHKAQDCRQARESRGRNENGGMVGFVGWNMTSDAELDEFESPWTFEEDLDLVMNPTIYVSSVAPEERADEPLLVASTHSDVTRCKAVIDCGASESLVGDFQLQEFHDELRTLGFDPDAEIQINRDVQKSFIFGNAQTSAALGLATVTAGILGGDHQFDVHVVPGSTPFLLSSRWLQEQEATINFKSGQAVFPKLTQRVIQLERAPTGHLLLPLTAFGGNTEVLNGLFVDAKQVDESLKTLSEAKPVSVPGVDH